jgi:transposase-like protein
MVDRVRVKKEVVRSRPAGWEDDERDSNIDPRSDYKAEYDKIAKMLCSKGATDTELADAFDVRVQTIYKWKHRYPSFAEALEAGKSEVFDPRVERTMAQMAIGYAIDIEEVKVTKDGDIVRYPIRKHYPPNVTAAIFWLKNRQPDRWRDVQDHNHNIKNLDNMSADDLRAEILRDAVEMGLSIPAMKKVAATGVVPPRSKMN